jgi:hypothetical protein
MKMQHLVWANGIVNAFPASLRAHDARVFNESPMQWQFEMLKHSDGRPMRCAADSAYTKDDHMVPTVGKASLAKMSAANRAVAKARNEGNKDFRMGVEDTFSKHVNLWPHSDQAKKHLIFKRGPGGDGAMAFDECADTWLCQVFFTNLHTCLHGYVVLNCACGVRAFLFV